MTNDRDTSTGSPERLSKSIQSLIDRDPEIASLVPVESVRQAICMPGQRLERMIDNVLEGYAERTAVGTRDYVIVKNSATGENKRKYKANFKTLTYAQLQARIHGVAKTWQHHPIHGVKPDEFVCIFGFTSVDFAVLDLATVYAHAITVPMQSSTSAPDISDIFATIKPATLATTITDLPVMIKHAVICDSIRSIVVFDYDNRDDSDREKFETAQAILKDSSANAELISLQKLEALGGPYEWNYLPTHTAGSDRMAAIIHSSGSTGKPKGAIIPESVVQSSWVSPKDSPPSVVMCLAPLNHLLGRASLIATLRQGGLAYFTLAPDMSTLFDDIRIARPTNVYFFPRVLELVFQHYQSEVARVLRTSDIDEAEAREVIKQEMAANYLGDRLLVGLVSGAPVATAVKEFIIDCFGIPLLDTYGNTEAGMIAVDGIIQRPPVIDYKLRDVPELGYYTTDKPYPRGELCFRSATSVSGYYKSPEATAELFDKDGFLCTGDIVEEYEPDHITIIDRRKDVLKLSQGEYVAVGTLSTVIEANSPVINQIYIYGNSRRSYLLAVVVPDQKAIAPLLGDNPREVKLKKLIRNDLQKVGKQENLKSFEIPRDFIIETEPFSQDNGLLSSVRKRLRPALKNRYGERLEAMYKEHEQGQEEQRRALVDPNSQLTVLEKLVKILEIDLNIQGIDNLTEKTFAELGGDSLGAVLFSLIVEEIFSVSIPADILLSPTSNPQKWAQHIDQALSGVIDRPTFASVHGKNASQITADDLELARFMDHTILDQASSLPECVAEPQTVLLTGANGFLGHIICLEWLEKLAAKDGKLVCLVRAADNATARVRLDSAFEGLDPELEARYKALAPNHLEVLAGDVGDDLLGLNEEDYRRLAENVDRVSHVAALVNHRFSYTNLFGPNVVGTAEIIRFAITKRKKIIDFVSTMAINAFLDKSVANNEDSPLLKHIELTNSYASGYGASKWASEHLLRKASQKCGLPINVFRGDMMLPHRIFKGQLNTADMFTRMIFSIIKTGLAPYSFYPLRENGTRTQGHYDGTPVDIVAAVVAGVFDNSVNECRIYNVQNYHIDDGCSFDTFVDWIEAAGYPISRIEDYQQWLERFKEALNGLPEEQRQHSALEILNAFTHPQPIPDNQVGSCRFKGLVKSLSIGPDVPNLSEEYINKCLQDMSLLGLISK